MSIVIENLKEALNGESKAKRKYELYAQKAKEENHPEIAHLFKAVSFAESIHIKNHLRALSVMKGSEIKLDDIVSINEEELEQKVNFTIYCILQICSRIFYFLF
jgi:rubrerythrin